MNFQRYQFSKVSETELVKFFKAVEQANQISSTSDLTGLWECFLPRDSTFCDKYKLHENVEVIEIDDSVTSQENIQNLNEVIPDDEVLEPTKFESEDFVVALQEYMETEDAIPEEMIKNLGSLCLNEINHTILETFANGLNSQYSYKLWNAISAASICVEQQQAVCFFVDRILIAKILTVDDKVVKMLLKDVCKSHLVDVATTCIKAMLEDTPACDFKILSKNLNTVSDNCKDFLLGQICSNLSRLELHHIPVITALLYPKTDRETVIKLVRLMVNVSNDYNSERSFGKLILDVIKALELSVIQVETQIAQLIQTNSTIFKAQANNLFEKYLQNRLPSI